MTSIEKFLINSEDYIRKLFDGIPISVYVWQYQNNDFILVDVNDTAKKYSFFDSNLSLGIKASTLFKKNPHIMQDLQFCYQKQKSLTKQLEYVIDSTNEVKFWSIGFNFIPPTLVLIQIDDITDKRKAEQQLIDSENKLMNLNKKLEQQIQNRTKKLYESEKKYRQLLENIDVGFYSVSIDGRMLNHNKAHNIILGYDPSESLKDKDVRIFWQYPEHRKAYIEQLLKNGVTKNYICHSLTKNGKKIVVELNSHLIRDENKNPIRIDGTFIDITDKFNLERKLKESEEKYRLICETAYDLIGILNKKFKYEYINENAFQQILGYSNNDLLGKSALKFTHPEDMSKTAKALFEGFKEGKGGTELRFKHKDGHWVWIEAKGKTFIDKDGELKAIIISRDITERKRNEDALKKSEKKYKNAYNQVNFYKDLFAHDINNILHIITSSTELLTYHLDRSEKSKIIEDILKIIKNTTERGAKLVSNVHMLSELEEEEIEIQPTEICELMRSSIVSVKKAYFDKNIDIKIDCAYDHLTVNGNKHLQEVFENTLINGIRYNDNKDIEIEVIVSKSLINAKNYIKMEFIDNGIGVPDERKQIIFKQGNRELKGSKGMGLGLSLVKKILKVFHGKIWVEDKVRGDSTKGSNFVILIPEFNGK
ncbi:MAG: PAS domain S-box protein [Candidatus Hermodarchaeota archaeon]